MENFEFEKLYKKRGFASQRRYPNEALIQFLARHFFSLSADKRAKTKILELGCGSGANVWMIAKEGFDAYGIDIAQTGISLCKEMLAYWKTNATVSVGDMRKLDFSDNFFDGMVDVVALQHTDLEGHKETYKEVFRCLKKGGRFFSWHLGAHGITFVENEGKYIDRITVDNIANPNVPLYNPDIPVGLTSFLSPTEAETLLSEAGFRNISIETVIRSYKNMTQDVGYLSIEAYKP